MLPIERAPYATTASALLILCVALALILWGRSMIWRSAFAKVVVSAIVLFAPTATGGIWLNSTNSQIYCGLISLVILCEDLSECSRRRLGLYVVLLLGCGRSGVYTTFLLPSFLYRWSWDRTPAFSALVAAVALTACVQVAVFVTFAPENAIAGSKFQEFDVLRSLLFLVYGQVIRPLGLHSATHFVTDALSLPRINLLQALGQVSVPVLGVSLLGIVLMLERRYHSIVNLLALAFLYLAVLTTGSATHGLPVGRYAAHPGFTLLLFLLAHLAGGGSSHSQEGCRLVADGFGLDTHGRVPERQHLDVPLGLPQLARRGEAMAAASQLSSSGLAGTLAVFGAAVASQHANARFGSRP